MKITRSSKTTTALGLTIALLTVVTYYYSHTARMHFIASSGLQVNHKDLEIDIEIEVHADERYNSPLKDRLTAWMLNPSSTTQSEQELDEIMTSMFNKELTTEASKLFRSKSQVLEEIMKDDTVEESRHDTLKESIFNTIAEQVVISPADAQRLRAGRIP